MSGSLERWTRAWPTMLTLLYMLCAWVGGIDLLLHASIGANALGVLLVAHALVISAYLIHECAHGAVFSSSRANDRLGVLLGWLNGACLASYARLKRKHLRHHADRLDVVTFDYRAALERAPPWLRTGVLALEWAYVPVIELWMRAMIIGAPFVHGGSRERARMVGLLAVRLAALTLLALLSVRALLLYALAYGLFLTVLRFLDAFQHTYEVHATWSLEAAPADPRRDLRYEYENTYSNLLALRLWWLNALVLNFPYHNAHHVRPSVPWHRLPALHRSLFGAADPQVIACKALLTSFHRHRVRRVLAQDYGSVARAGDRASGFVGAVGVSFLTAV